MNRRFDRCGQIRRPLARDPLMNPVQSCARLCNRQHKRIYVLLAFMRGWRASKQQRMRWTVERPPHNCSECAQESHQRRIIAPMGSPLRRRFKRSTLCQHLSFALEVNLCIDVGCVDRDMPQPRAYGVDIDAGAQEMSSGCVADRVWTDTFPQQRWATCGCFSDVLPQHLVDAVARQWLPKPVKEYGLIGRTVSNEGGQTFSCCCPEWAAACFPSFTEQPDDAHRAGVKIQVCDLQASGL
jgi:hypothetical protein